MKKSVTLLLAGILLISTTLSAQAVSKDSISVLKNEKEMLKVEKDINNNKLKLAKLENQLAERNNDVQKTAEVAEAAVRDNLEAANNLSNDSKDKEKVKRAHKAAGNAESSAKKARKALDKLSDLNKDIESLKNKIREDELRLVGMGGTVLLVQ